MTNMVIGARLNRKDVDNVRLNRHDVTLYMPANPGGSSDPPPAGGTLVWDADFSAISGTTPPATEWTLFDTLNAGTDFAGGPPKSSNHFIDGSGNLILRSQRETAGWRGPNNQYPTTAYFSGAFLGTFGYGTGWPTTGPKKKVWTAPFAIESRLKWPDMPGGWGGLWMMPANKNNTTQGAVEIDWGEERLARPTQYGAHQHWTGNNASGVRLTDQSASYPYNVPSVLLPTSSDLRAWRTFRVEIYASGAHAMRPRYYLDGVLQGSGPAIRNAPDGEGSLQTDVELGLMIDWRQAPLGVWGGAYSEGGPYLITGDAATNTITCAGHGLTSGYPIQFYDLSGGAGLTGRATGQPPGNVNYYARDIASNTFTVAATPGGAVVDFTTNITGGKIARGGFNYPNPSTLGPWDLTVDYIRAYDLTGVTPP